ncbi:MAG: hypothetical protein AUI50_06490 [Crenarchaeota archaeon 13_1_40CM_2_52_14]|nr:MAG: hypothetical protein AUI97_09205 [Crenarchaeota archaeon 13_1_40CM_3_52_17]OLD34461.1 MAG: hypothetical protein AUI50_06490 [Crenarchaeota archaeon 13_1_40CM_2_52_14]
MEPFEPGSPDRESGILSAKLVDRAILPEQGLPENMFQLRIVVFSNLIPALTHGDSFVNHQPRYRRNRNAAMNTNNTSTIVAASAIFCRFVSGFPLGGGRGGA